MPVGRARILEDKSLGIMNVEPSDEGVYICDAQNDVGSISARATLTVHCKFHLSRPSIRCSPSNFFVPAPPAFTMNLTDLTLPLNAKATFDCSAKGNPKPSVFWSREGSQELLFPGNDYGHLHITQDGTLIIRGVTKDDAAFYICSTLSAAGSATARASLVVTSVVDVPPPVIVVGPTNQSLPLHSQASLPCKAHGDFSLSMNWFKDGEPLQSDQRIKISKEGMLDIDGK